MTVASVASLIPGGLTYWNRLRIEKITVWLARQSSSADQLQVTLPNDDSAGVPAMSFTDNAVTGATLPCVAFKLGLLQRARWYNPSSNVVLFIASGGGSSGDPAGFIMDFSVEIASNPLSQAAS